MAGIEIDQVQGSFITASSEDMDCVVRSVSQLFPDVSWVFFTALLCNAGMSMAATTFLPSTFAMRCLTAATIALLQHNTRVKQVMCFKMSKLVWWIGSDLVVSGGSRSGMASQWCGCSALRTVRALSATSTELVSVAICFDWCRLQSIGSV